MATIDNLLEGRATVKESALDLIRDPLAFFDMSYTKMHSVPRSLLEQLQTEALSQRFEEQKERIPALSKLAAAQGIKSVQEFNEVLPLCFEHTLYKSYPAELLNDMRFDKLTTWLGRLSAYDVSHVDASGCNTIHSWLDLLENDTELGPVTSSGTTGKMSFSPRHKSDWRTQVLGGLRIQLSQKFGEPPTDANFTDKYHVCWPTYPDGHTSQFRLAYYLYKYLALECGDHFHPVYDTPADTDLLYLGAQLRLAKARGEEPDHLPPSLLARVSEMEAIQRDNPARTAAWLESIMSEMKGKRVFLMSHLFPLYQLAKTGLKSGHTCGFAPDSILLTGGGAKGAVLPDDLMDVATRFFDIKYTYMYGFSEQTALSFPCELGRFHIPPWAIPLVLDPQTSRPLPREGVQVGRAAFFDVAIKGIWGGCISGDKVEIDWDPCPCGRTSPHLTDSITRFSEEQGGVDEITPTATQQAHAALREFLNTV